MDPADVPRASTGTTVGRAVQQPSNQRTVRILTVVLILLILLLVVTSGWKLPVSVRSPRVSQESPTPALPTPALQSASAQEPAQADASQPLQPIIDQNARDQALWDTMSVGPVTGQANMPNMWFSLPNDADYVVAHIDQHDQWMLSIWHGPTYVPSGDAVTMDYWEFPPGTPAEEILNRRNALAQVLQVQGRYRVFPPDTRLQQP